MRKLLMAAGSIFFLLSCSENFKKGEDGLQYKIISEGKGALLKRGQFFKVDIAQVRVRKGIDSVLQDSRNMMPYIDILDTLTMPKPYFAILSQVRKGDSLVIRTSVDSAFKKSGSMGMPPFFKSGDFIDMRVKVHMIFNSREEAELSRKKSEAEYKTNLAVRQKEQIKKEEGIIQEYLKKNNITAVKAPKGTYVQIIQQGTGALADSNYVVKTNYTGRTLAGKTFDSNTDSAFNHVEPFNVNLTNNQMLGGVIEGWKDGLSLLSKGAKAKFIIPSPLAYGENGAGEDIKPNEILVFDIEVLDFITPAQAKVELEQKMKKMQSGDVKKKDSATVKKNK